ncbi:MAG: hypothetical protein Q4G40_09970 [Brachybacterium sp.]|nr:hypothetical protein [Brachybacterium sp.]
MTQPPGTPTDGTTITERDMAGALEVLATAGPDPVTALVLTDEEISGLDGADALAMTGSPFLSQEGIDAEASAIAAVRSLTARGLIRTDRDDFENEGEMLVGDGDPSARRVQLELRLAGILALRRIPEAMVTVERTLEGGTTRGVYYFFPAGGVLEEYVTTDGFHQFSVPTSEAVSERVRTLVDPFEVAGDSDGTVESMTLAEASARADASEINALSLITSFLDDVGYRATVIGRPTELQMIDNGPTGPGSDAPDREVQVLQVSRETVNELIAGLLPQLEQTDDDTDAAASS